MRARRRRRRETRGATAATQKQPLPPATFDASTDPDKPATQTSSAFNRGGDPFPGLSPDGTIALMRFAFSGKDGDVMDDARCARRRASTSSCSSSTSRPRARSSRRTARRSSRSSLRVKRDEALSLYVKRLRDQAKDDIKVDDNYIQEAKADGGSASEDEDEY